LEEILLVEQVVTTLTGLPGLEKVQFLVDGERRDTLMGHVSADEPLGREDF
jgi:spore germination protein GerM